MKDKKKYYELDEIGFVGTQKKNDKTVAQDISDTVQVIKSKKANNISPKRPAKNAVPRLLK